MSVEELDFSEYVEVDPTGRYGRYNEILGKGASKTVYRAFDEYQGIEVAWNQVRLCDYVQNPGDLERLYCEIHLLKTLKHKNIMKFHTSWVDTANRNINFVTEMFTSGTLRQYRLKHRRVSIRAVKHWCRQILQGLHYLHTQNPPVIHRDLKCDNIFINGNQGEVKIGDLGLAAILRKSHAACCVGTPEFMAPEVYDEEYNELVDIYAFGMCMLEMVTSEYPYSECTHAAEIYKKVTSGKRPGALYKVKDPEVQEFIEKCLAAAPARLSAGELLHDPFLQIDDYGSDFESTQLNTDVDAICPVVRGQLLDCCTSALSCTDGSSNGNDFQSYEDWEHRQLLCCASGIELFEHQEDEHPPDVDVTVKGKRKDDGNIHLRIRIADRDGRGRNIYFPFDIEIDTALTVATEMVAELDITDQDVTKIADMIDEELASLVPEWNPGWEVLEEKDEHCFTDTSFCHNYASSDTSVVGSLLEFGAHNLRILEAGRNCQSHHGRFEEITWQVNQLKHHAVDTLPAASSDGSLNTESWGNRESFELGSSVASGHNNSGEETCKLCRNSCSKDGIGAEVNRTESEEDYRDVQLEIISSKSSSFYSCEAENDDAVDNSFTSGAQGGEGEGISPMPARDLHPSYRRQCVERSSPSSGCPRARDCEVVMEGYLATSSSLFSGSSLPSSISRSTLFQVDAV